jgi:DOPA 4,5-dioxygenase
MPILNPAQVAPPTDLATVVESEIKEWHFHIYFHQTNQAEHQAALRLRDAVLRLRRDGAFVAVPLYRVNTAPIGPHPVGSYEIWVPSECFSSVYSYLLLNRNNLSILVHPLTKEPRKDHDVRATWMGNSYPLDLSTLPNRADELPVQYTSLKLGYTATPTMTLEMRLKLGTNVEHLLASEKEAAKAPPREPQQH